MKAFSAFYHHQNNQELPMNQLALSWANLVSLNFSRQLSLILRRHIHVSFHNIGTSKIAEGQKLIEISSFKAPIDFYLGISKDVLPYVTHYFFGGIERNYQKLSNPNSFSESYILENFGKVFTSTVSESFKSIGPDLGLGYSHQIEAELCEAYLNSEDFHLISFSFEDHGEFFELSFYLPLNFFNKLSLV